MQNTVSPNVFDKRLKIHGTKRRLPQTVIIGIRKCGTRALIEMLGLHPNVVKSEPEIHFFDDDIFYANGLDWYRKKMPFSFDSQVIPNHQKSIKSIMTPLFLYKYFIKW